MLRVQHHEPGLATVSDTRPGGPPLDGVPMVVQLRTLVLHCAGRRYAPGRTLQPNMRSQPRNRNREEPMNIINPTINSVLMLAAGISIGAAGIAIADRPAASAASSDARIVRELRSVNTNLSVLNKTIGGYSNVSPVRSLDRRLQDIDDSMRKVCSNTGAIDGASYKYC